MIAIYFLTLISVLIVHTEDNRLHFIKEGAVESVYMSQIGNDAIERPLERSSSVTTIQPSMREYIDNIHVSRDGFVIVDNMQYSMQELYAKPVLYNGIIFELQKTCRTTRYNDVIIFIVNIDLLITDSKSMYKRVVTFHYVYCPFDEHKDVFINNNRLRVGTAEYPFTHTIVAVYDTVLYDESLYMRRVWNDGTVVSYQPPDRSHSMTPYYTGILMFASAILWRILRPRTYSLLLKEYETKLYEVYHGRFKTTKIICKKFKNNYDCVSKEISLMGKLHHPSLHTILNYDKRWCKPCVLYEYSDIVSTLNDNEIKQVINAIAFLHEQEFSYKNFNPLNIRKRDDRILLFDVFAPEVNNYGWYSESASTCMYTRDVFAVGILLHYFMTGYHPYDLPSAVVDRQVYDRDNRKIYNTDDMKKLNDNMISGRFLIRFTDPLMHDLVYHALKCTTTIHRLNNHPFFWTSERKFAFIANYSDIIEGTPPAAKKLERNKGRIFASDWSRPLLPVIKAELEVFRHYKYNTAKDLVRVIRNKGRHYNEIPAVAKAIYKSFPDGYVEYWTKLFPGLLVVCYNCGESLKKNEMLCDFY